MLGGEICQSDELGCQWNNDRIDPSRTYLGDIHRRCGGKETDTDSSNRPSDHHLRIRERCSLQGGASQEPNDSDADGHLSRIFVSYHTGEQRAHKGAHLQHGSDEPLVEARASRHGAIGLGKGLQELGHHQDDRDQTLVRAKRETCATVLGSSESCDRPVA